MDQETVKAAARFRGLLAPLLLVGALYCNCQDSSPAPVSRSSALHTPPPDSAYAGNEACASCHEKEAGTYLVTPHYLDSTLPSEKTILGSFTPGDNVVRTRIPNLIYAMIHDGDGFFQSAIDITDPQNLKGRAERFDVVVGSGRHGQSYFYWKGDQLFELPVSYWTWTHEWINSPGYIDGQVNFERPAEPRCLECHATRFDATPPPSNSYRPDSLMLGIGCERCHGPGAEHVRRMKSVHPPAAGSPDLAIVNPAHLSRDRQLDLCALCHASPGVPIAPAMSFRAGDAIADYVKIAPPSIDVPPDVHGNQVAALRASKCFSSGKLTCSTCHNVHHTQEAAASFSAHCLQCHTLSACPRSKLLGEGIRTRCVECHMPVRKSTVVTGGSEGSLLQAELRAHRIAVYPDTQ